MDPLLGELTAELQGIKPMSPTAGIYSTVHEGSYIKPGSEPIHDVEYWKKGLRHSVYFTHGIRNAVDSGHTTFLELAPNPVALMQVGLTTAVGRAARRPADPDAGPQAGRGRVDHLDPGAAVRLRPRPGHPDAVHAPAAARRITRTSRRPGSSAKSTGWTRTSPATARC